MFSLITVSQDPPWNDPKEGHLRALEHSGAKVFAWVSRGVCGAPRSGIWELKVIRMRDDIPVSA